MLVGMSAAALGCAGRGAPETSAGAATAAATATATAVPGAAVRPGIEVLLADSAHLVRGRRVGLVTNQTGVDGRGRRDVDRLREAGIRVTTLFGPEHGLYGRIQVDAAVERPSFVDSSTGLPAYELHDGRRPVAPTPEQLSQVDVLLVDLQDVGARYYTYTVTASLVMEAAARAGLPVVILDRPNPIGGLVQGNALDTLGASAVARLPLAMRHGMTLGEVSRLARGALGLDLDLRIVPAAGWRRGMRFEHTGLPFVPPSLNLRSPESLYHYPGLCLFEGTNLSVGRGTGDAFRQVGAPWLDTTAVLARLRAARVPGVSFEGAAFTPRAPGDGKHPDTPLTGIRLTATDPARYDPTLAAAHLLAALRAVHPDAFAFTPAQFDRLAGGPETREAILRGEGGAAVAALWAPSRARFLDRRRPFLIYPE